MNDKSHTMMFALTGSLMLVMLCSAVGFSPRTEAQEQVISGIEASEDDSPFQDLKNFIIPKSPRAPEIIKAEISDFISANKPDEAKVLYDELYAATH